MQRALRFAPLFVAMMGLGCNDSTGPERIVEVYIDYFYSGDVNWSGGANSKTYAIDPEGDICSGGGYQSWYIDGEHEGDLFAAGCNPEPFWFGARLDAVSGGEPGWPNADQEVLGFFRYQDISVPVSYSVKLLESVGTFYLPPDGPTRDYVREFTVEGKVDCAEFPELGCEGVYELSLRTRIDFDSVELFGSE